MADGRQKYMEEINIYGYMRVSSKEQNEDRQKIALTEMGVPENNTYMDMKKPKELCFKRWHCLSHSCKPIGQW